MNKKSIYFEQNLQEFVFRAKQQQVIITYGKDFATRHLLRWWGHVLWRHDLPHYNYFVAYCSLGISNHLDIWGFFYGQRIASRLYGMDKWLYFPKIMGYKWHIFYFYCGLDNLVLQWRQGRVNTPHINMTLITCSRLTWVDICLLKGYMKSWLFHLMVFVQSFVYCNKWMMPFRIRNLRNRFADEVALVM